jgi:hypothetical protein
VTIITDFRNYSIATHALIKITVLQLYCNYLETTFTGLRKQTLPALKIQNYEIVLLAD